jgi:hypothetical protein
MNEFNIYNLNHQYLQTVITDQNGYTSIDLPYGSYIIKQMSVAEGYQIAQEFNFFVDFIEGQTIFEIINDKVISVIEEIEENNNIEEETEEENNNIEEETEEEKLPDLYIGENIFIYVVGCYICIKRLLHQ